MFRKLRNLYYKIKYSNLKGGAVGVIIGNKKSKTDFDEKVAEHYLVIRPMMRFLHLSEKDII